MSSAWRASYFLSCGALHVLRGQVHLRVDLDTRRVSSSRIVRALVVPADVYDGGESAGDVQRRARSTGAPLDDPSVAVGHLLYTDSLNQWRLTSMITAAREGIVVDRVGPGADHIVAAESGRVYSVTPDGVWSTLLPGGASEASALDANDKAFLVIRTTPPRGVVLTDSRSAVWLFIDHGGKWTAERVFDFEDGPVEGYEAVVEEVTDLRVLTADGWTSASPEDLAAGDLISMAGESFTVGLVEHGLLVARARRHARHFAICGWEVSVVDGDELWPWTPAGIDPPVQAGASLADADVIVKLRDE